MQHSNQQNSSDKIYVCEILQNLNLMQKMSTQSNQQPSGYVFSKVIECFHKNVLLSLLIWADDIELDLGLKKTVLVINLHRFIGISTVLLLITFRDWKLTGSYNMKNNFNIICISGIYLHSSIQHDNKRLHLSGHKLETNLA